MTRFDRRPRSAEQMKAARAAISRPTEIPLGANVSCPETNRPTARMAVINDADDVTTASPRASREALRAISPLSSSSMNDPYTSAALVTHLTVGPTRVNRLEARQAAHHRARCVAAHRP